MGNQCTIQVVDLKLFSFPGAPHWLVEGILGENRVYLGSDCQLWLPKAFLFFFKYFFLSLAVPDLNHGTQDLPSSLQHVKSVVVACGI